MHVFDRDILARAFLIGVIIALIGFSARPHQADWAFLQSRLALQEDNSRLAALYLEKLAENFPWWKNLWLYSGRYAARGGASKSAIQYFIRYGMADDMGLEDQLLLVDSYLQTGDLENAEQLLLHAARYRTPSELVYSRLAEIYRIEEDSEALTDALRSLFKLQPNNASLAYELGLLLSTQEPESALSYLEEAAQQDSRFRESALKLQREIITARLAEEPAYTFLSAGRSLAAMSEWRLAAQAFRQATRTRPDYAEAWAFLGEAKQHLAENENHREPDPAILSDLETALRLNPRSVTANVLMGIFWERQNQFNQALKYIRTASNLDPNNSMLHTELGKVLAHTGDLESAQKEYERAVAISPQDPTYWCLLAEFSLHYQMQVREIALPAARRAVILAPDDPQSLDVLGQTLVILGDNLNAEHYFRQSLELDGDFAPAHLHLGVVYMNQGDSDRARLHFDLAKKIAPDPWTFEQAERLIGYYFP